MTAQCVTCRGPWDKKGAFEIPILCDAQPWFRIFNPVTQSERFDAHGKFIRRYLPQLAALPDKLIHAPWLARPIDLAAANVELTKDYALPVVQHDEARERTLKRYALVKNAAY